MYLFSKLAILRCVPGRNPYLDEFKCNILIVQRVSSARRQAIILNFTGEFQHSDKNAVSEMIRVNVGNTMTVITVHVPKEKHQPLIFHSPAEHLFYNR